MLGSSSSDNTIRLWDVENGNEQVVFYQDNDAESLAFSPDGKTLASASSDNKVHLWEVASGKELNVLEGHRESVTSVSFSPNGFFLASASYDETIRVWNLGSERIKFLFQWFGNFFSAGHLQNINNLNLSKLEKNVRFIKRVKTTVLKEISQTIIFKKHNKFVSAVAFSPDGKVLSSASGDGTLRLWDIASGVEQSVFKGHEGEINSVVFSPDGTLLASASFDKTVRVWNRDTRPYTLFLHNSKPTPLYHTFIKAVKFLWQLDVEGLEIVETKRRTPADLKKYGSLLAPPPPNQSKFDQVLEWAEKQQGK